MPLADVGFSGTNGASCTTSNTSGEYACTVLAGWTGTVTPAATGYAFTPASRNYTSIAADAPNEDYPATLQSPTATISFIHVDHLNTPRAVSNLSGQTIWRWDQVEPFGVNVPDEDPDSNSVSFVFPLRFSGQYADKETNLHYNYFRDYDSGIGRYVQSDPIGLDGGLNTYAYVGGQPLFFVDPLGLAEIPNPNNAKLPGGPWTPAGKGQRPGTFYGPPQPSGARAMCTWVPPAGLGGPPGSIGYWKVKFPGMNWLRFNQAGRPITAAQAHRIPIPRGGRGSQ